MRNAFLPQLQAALGSRKVGSPRRRNFYSRHRGGGRKRRFANQAQVAPVTSEGLLANGVQHYHKPLPAPNIINTGRRSIFSSETPLHNNAVSLTITNNDASNQADLVLFAGRHEGDHTNQLLQDGTNNYTNDAAQVVEVVTTAEYGIDGTAGTWDKFQKAVELDGFVIGVTRLQFDTKTQLSHKLRFQQMEFFGDHTIDHIFPQVYYNPSQFDLLTVQSNLAYPLTDQTLVKYTLLAGETVVMTFWVDGYYEKQRHLSDFARRKGGNSLM